MADAGAPEWQKTLAAAGSNIATAAPYLAAGPLAVPAIGAAVTGALLREPTPEAPPTLVSGAPDQQPPAPLPNPQVMPPMALVGANLGALGAHARKIGQAGADALASGQEANKKFLDAGAARQEAVGDAAAIQQQKGNAAAESYDQQIAEHINYQNKLKTIADGEKEAVESAKNGYAAALEDAKYAGIAPDKRRELQAIMNNRDATDVQKASAKAQLDKATAIDPDQYLGSAGRKITAAIAYALGAMGAARTGGPNQAMQIIQSAIHDNIEAQKHSFSKRDREAEKAKDNIGATKEQFASDRGNALRDYGIALEMTKMKLGKITAGLDGDEAVARGAELQAALDQESIKNATAIEQAARGDYAQSLAQQGSLMATKVGLEEKRADDARAASGGGEALEGYVFTGKTTPTKPALDRAQKGQALSRSANALIDEAIALRDKHGSEHGGGPVQARMEVIQNELITHIGQLSDAGVIQSGERERFEDALGSVAGVGFVTDRLKALRWTVNNRADAAARAAGFTPEQKRTVPGEQPVARK